MTTPHQGLILSPFDKRWTSGIDWESLQREANAKDQKAARIRERNAGKPFLEQPPNYREPKPPKPAKPIKPAPKPRPQGYTRAERIPRAVRKQTGDFPGTFVVEEDSKTGRLRAALKEHGPMSSAELGKHIGITGRQAGPLMKHDVARGNVLQDRRTLPHRFYVPSNPPKDLT